MDMQEVSTHISDLLEANRSVYLKTEPEAPDFTNLSGFKLQIHGKTTFVQLEIQPQDIIEIIGMFDSTIFDKERVDRVFFWNFKSLCSYFYFYTKKLIKPSVPMFDLKIIENFLAVKKNQPQNYSEFLDRFKFACQNKDWPKLYKTIHLPLSQRVLPLIETRPLLNQETKQPEYPYYEIEGQITGRMNCYRKYAKCYVPHNLGPDKRHVLKPRGWGVCFLTTDFRHCEVTVLQWLSKDQTLAKLLSEGDLHNKIYEEITGDPCDTEVKRNKSKLMFLPVMYGCGATRLSSLISVPVPVASELIARIKLKFKTAWDWMYERQEMAKLGPIVDHFGRPRLFTPDESYKARDFSVQGVAATICQEKLIELDKNLENVGVDLAFVVHDGYCMTAKVSAVRNACKILKQVLESESVICPGLKMKIEIKLGVKLDEMKSFGNK